MQALLAATTVYLDAPFADATEEVLTQEEENAVRTARTILVMASDSLGDPPTLAREADISFTESELHILAKAAAACLDAGVALEGLRSAYAKVAPRD
jgi:hypothetical protein